MLTRDEHGRLARDPRGIPDRATFEQRLATARRWRYLLAAMLFVVATGFQSADADTAGDLLGLGALLLAGWTFLRSVRGG